MRLLITYDMTKRVANYNILVLTKLMHVHCILYNTHIYDAYV